MSEKRERKYSWSFGYFYQKLNLFGMADTSPVLKVSVVYPAVLMGLSISLRNTN